jgi:hypothetical protein
MSASTRIGAYFYGRRKGGKDGIGLSAACGGVVKINHIAPLKEYFS